MAKVTYTEDNIRSLDWKEHIRMRAGMYIGKLGDGTAPDDGIYILLKEVMDNSIDEFAMGFGKEINVKVEDVPQFTLGGNISICAVGGQATLKGPAGMNSYQWNTGDTTPRV